MAGAAPAVESRAMAIDLRSHTPARVALGRTGHSLPTTELLRFQLDHARARDAVYESLDPGALALPHILVRSAARDREELLRRPDLGRRLAGAALPHGDYDAAIVIADGVRPRRGVVPDPASAGTPRDS